VKRLLGVGIAAALLAAPGAAQEPEPEAPAPPPPALMSNFPYLMSTPNDGLFGAFRVIRYRQAPWDARVTNLREHSIDVAYSTRSSYLVRGDYKRLWLDEGWRVRARLEASREVRFGRSDVPEIPDFAESMRRDRRQGWVDVTRRIDGPLSVALRGAVDRTQFRGDRREIEGRYPFTTTDRPDPCAALPPNSPCPAVYLSTTLTQTDAQLRAALVLDTRDNEYNPNRGLLIEAGAFTGSGGDGYTGGYGIARGWISPHRGTRLTARYAFRALSRTTAVGIQHEMPGWESPVTTFGGGQSHRALPVGALAGRGLLLGGVELRHELLDFGGLGAITVLGFVDGGRAFQDPSPLADPAPGSPVPSGKLAFTFKDWTWGAGGGIGLRILRAAQLNLTAAKANGETRWYVGSGWSW
jgi:outer membrane protein assembly factor BamA